MYKRIRDLREDNDLTQKELASILSCSQQVYSNYELGQRDIPTDILWDSGLHFTSRQCFKGCSGLAQEYENIETELI